MSISITSSNYFETNYSYYWSRGGAAAANEDDEEGEARACFLSGRAGFSGASFAFSSSPSGLPSPLASICFLHDGRRDAS